jgi:hypothetical protein
MVERWVRSSQWPVVGWVTKIYCLELLRASEGTLSRWSRLHLQSLAPTPVSWRVNVRLAAGRKNNCRMIITTCWKHQPTALSGKKNGSYHLILMVKYIHYHSRFILEGVAEASQIFLRDAHVLPKLLAKLWKREVIFFYFVPVSTRDNNDTRIDV